MNVSGTALRSLFLGLVLFPASAVGQVQASLGDIGSWGCTFELRADGAWDGESPEATIESGAPLRLVIDNVRLEAGLARIVAESATENVTVFEGDEVLHFLESTPSGNLNVTTLSLGAPETTKSVPYTRHIAMGGSSVVSEAHGHCRVRM